MNLKLKINLWVELQSRASQTWFRRLTLNPEPLLSQLPQRNYYVAINRENLGSVTS